MREEMIAGVSAYAADVRGGSFPAPEHTYSIDDDELQTFEAGLDETR
jgi:3-methyl-2-oxobutanoate hydroxymethyltransferase